MGRSHATSGAIVWLAGCVTATACGVHPGLPATVVGAVACAGAALLPDIDHPCSTVARTGGILTQEFSALVAHSCARVHAATRTRRDRVDVDGHRTLTHTAVFALALGLAAAGLSWLGRPGTAVVVATIVALGVLGATRRRRHRAVAVPAGILAAALTVGAQTGPLVIGGAVAAGCLAHCLGDAATNSGCPILWPIRIAGRRWYRVGTPRAIRFGTGSQAEAVVLVTLLAGGIAEAGWLLAVS